MNTGRVKAPLIDYIEVNPRETIIKGSMAKKNRNRQITTFLP